MKVCLGLGHKLYRNDKYSKIMIKFTLTLKALLACLIVGHHRIMIGATQFSIGIEHDMSKPTFGLQGPTSSKIQYNDRDGLALRGTIGDILGPPIKMANGFHNVVSGSNMAGLGQSLRTDGAVLGVDAKLLEAAGGAKLLKGGLLLGGVGAKTALATAKAGPLGKKISSIVEFPVKVVAVKDIAAGTALKGLGQKKMGEAEQFREKGANMIQEGNQLKQQGYNQVMQGASEGMQNIGNMFQQTSQNAASAFKLLPILLDLPMGNEPQQTQQQIEQHPTDSSKSPVQQTSFGHRQGQHGGGLFGGSAAGAMTGGSLFGGLGSLLPGMSGGADPLMGGGGHNGPHRSPILDLISGVGGSGFGGGNPNILPPNGYAAILNATNPLTNLLMAPGMNPLLMPLSGGMNGGPLAQSAAMKGPQQQHTLSPFGFNSGATTSSFNLIPGLRITEKVSMHGPQDSSASLKGGQRIEQQQQQQQVIEQTPAKMPPQQVSQMQQLELPEKGLKALDQQPQVAASPKGN